MRLPNLTLTERSWFSDEFCVKSQRAEEIVGILTGTEGLQL